jgi:Protein of unknown function (DUF2478)
MTMIGSANEAQAGQIAQGGDALLAFLRYDTAPDGDLALARFARGLLNRGRRVAGVIQSDRPRPGRRKCDMILENLATGETICISVDRGDEARGCRLDHAALAEATLWVERALTLNPEVLVLNKFGKEEALGRGFFPAMVEALALGIPVVAGVSALNLAAAQTLTGGVATLIEPRDTALDDWFDARAIAVDSG